MRYIGNYFKSRQCGQPQCYANVMPQCYAEASCSRDIQWGQCRTNCREYRKIANEVRGLGTANAQAIGSSFPRHQIDQIPTKTFFTGLNYPYFRQESINFGYLFFIFIAHFGACLFDFFHFLSHFFSQWRQQ